MAPRFEPRYPMRVSQTDLARLARGMFSMPIQLAVRQTEGFAAVDVPPRRPCPRSFKPRVICMSHIARESSHCTFRAIALAAFLTLVLGAYRSAQSQSNTLIHGRVVSDSGAPV